MIVFSTMILLALDPVEATKTMSKNRFYIEIAYDNFMLFGGKYAEDKMFMGLIEKENTGVIDKNYIKSIHMPYDELEADSMLLETILNRMVKWLNFSQEIGASIAVFHTLKSSQDPLTINLNFFQRIAKEAMDRGIRVAVENRLEKGLFGSTPQDLKRLVKALNIDIGICLDVGHANINNNLRFFLEELGDHIIELHLHDNDGFKDLHRPPFTGTVNWHLVLDWVKRRRTVLPVFEVACRESPSQCLALAEEIGSWFNSLL